MEPRTFFLVDIDGTIADLSHRLHFIQLKPADWDGFFAACPGDAPIYNVIETLRILARNPEVAMILISGRSEAVRNETLNWLNSFNVPCDELYMRKEGDHRTDDIVKAELLDKFLKGYDITESSVTAAFEDRDQVVKMYRSRGIRVFQVAEGNF
jgi:hypothetical protein